MIKKSLITVVALGTMTLCVNAGDVVNINKSSEAADRIAKEDLSTKKIITEESLGLRKTNLYEEEAETVGEFTDYSRPAAGASQVFERAFTNAPPMIPHDIEGMLPIVKNNNICLSCHMPEMAKNIPGATAIPASHFATFRPTTSIGKDGKMTKSGKSVDNTSDLLTVVTKMDTLSHSRFNCSQCHAPQAKQEPLVGNTFRPDFGDSGLNASSNLLDVINEGVQ